MNVSRRRLECISQSDPESASAVRERERESGETFLSERKKGIIVSALHLLRFHVHVCFSPLHFKGKKSVSFTFNSFFFVFFFAFFFYYHYSFSLL